MLTNLHWHVCFRSMWSASTPYQKIWSPTLDTVHQPIQDSSRLPLKHWPPTLDLHPSADWLLHGVAEPDHGTVPLSLQQLWARQQGQTPSRGGIRIQQLSACFKYDDTILGHVPLEPCDAVQSTEIITSIIGEPSWPYTRGIGREAPDSTQTRLLDAKQWQTKYTGGTEIMFNVGHKVRLLRRHFRMTRPSRKIDFNHVGLYTVSNVMNSNPYKLDLPKMMRHHKVFQRSQLDW